MTKSDFREGGRCWQVRSSEEPVGGDSQSKMGKRGEDVARLRMPMQGHSPPHSPSPGRPGLPGVPAPSGIRQTLTEQGAHILPVSAFRHP